MERRGQACHLDYSGTNLGECLISIEVNSGQVIIYDTAWAFPFHPRDEAIPAAME